MRPAPFPSSVSILGVPVDDVDMGEALDRIAALVADGRRTGCCHQVATVNADFVVNTLADSELASIMRRTALSVPDGMAIVWGARLLGTPLRTRVAGADLIPALAARSANDGLRIALYGAAPGVAVRAARLLAERHRGLEIWATAGPAFGHPDDLTSSDLAPLRDADVDICCVAFGNPKQEHFIARFGAELGIPVMIGVGGSLDFLVGEQRRAPHWMQMSGLEWLHRASTDPRRLSRRYARDARVFLPQLGRQALTARARRADREPPVRPSASRPLDGRSAPAPVAHIDGQPTGDRAVHARRLAELVSGLGASVP